MTEDSAPSGSNGGGKLDAETGSSNSGLLDLSIELSSPQVFSGSKFALYLHIKNPFSKPIWIRKVTTNLPSAVHSVEDDAQTQENEGARVAAAQNYLNEAMERLIRIERRLGELDSQPVSDEREKEADRLKASANDINARLSASRDLLLTQQGYGIVSLADKAHVRIENARLRNYAWYVNDQAMLHVEDMLALDDVVALRGSLPIDVALQAGSSNVWTITLSTKKNPFFLPAAYRLNITVLYSFDPPSDQVEQATSRIHSNVAPATVNIRSSLWSVMGGSVCGGLLGATARLLQQVGSTAGSHDASSILSPLLLAAVLSIAASIFAARKSETQSFVSVEDFWGGALVGFLIGYSGTAAFESLTRISR
ncbi:hypothetical protein [Actinoplanes regularis]|uniref:hypothetical protein n=1 Tax=Actinoplanes regularis TaxID=52697 RepID=UPI0024A17EC3|nr:hypothetical protein [Actinoplanes regularis]GLW31974.1 hypothetical protein Areg01_49130 [Actinoplanes regularis]